MTRKTFVSHGRKDKPDERVRDKPLVSMVSMSEVEDDRHVLHSDEVESDEEDDPFDDPLGLDGGESQRTGSAQLSAAEVTLFLLDWMCTHKVYSHPYCFTFFSCRHMQ